MWCSKFILGFDIYKQLSLVCVRFHLFVWLLFRPINLFFINLVFHILSSFYIRFFHIFVLSIIFQVFRAAEHSWLSDHPSQRSERKIVQIIQVRVTGLTILINRSEEDREVEFYEIIYFATVHSYTVLLSLSLSLTYTHTHIPSLSLPPTLTLSLSHTHTHTISLTHTLLHPISSRDGWVDYLELSKRTDFNPSTTTFFWFLDKANLERSILEHSYKTIFNLRTR